MDKDAIDLPPDIKFAIEEIKTHQSVLKTKSIINWKNAIVLETVWQVVLPNVFNKSGISKTGVRKTEPVYWVIPLSYPLRAPTPRLRDDFPTNLPHINPYSKGNWVYPCVSEIALEDLLHSQGLKSILNITTQWLNNAAADELQCPVQGWEPVRRDNTNGMILIDSDSIRKELDKKNNTVRFYDYRYFYMTNKDDLMLGKVITPCLGTANSSYKNKNTGIRTDIRYAPGILFQTKPIFIADQYHPETVTNYKSLKEFSTHLELNVALEIRLKYILSVLKSNSSKQPVEEFLVIFAVKRPFKLIGLNSYWELLAYRIFFSIDGGEILNDDTAVKPTLLIDSCSDNLLQKTSGVEVDNLTNVAMLGCGSLGSKITLHLAKTGRFSFELIDNDFFSSHNNARHAVLVSDFNPLLTSKSHLLSNELSKINIKSEPIKNDIRNLNKTDGFSLNKRTNYIIDTTASLAIRYFLSHLHSNKLQGRLIHSVLYDKASLAVVAIEAESRTVRIDDLMAFMNTLCITNTNIQNALYNQHKPERQNYAEGCRSVTTTMSDMDISLMAAAVSLKIDALITLNKPMGFLQVGIVNNSTLNMEWNGFNFLATKVIPKDDNFEWNIRILGNIVKDIKYLSETTPDIENGGVIAGQICTLSKTIYVTYLIDAPEGTIKTASNLELNTNGLASIFDGIHQKTNGQVTFLGTWHSHIGASPPSPKDISTLKKLQINYDLPIVMLVYTGGRLVRVNK